MCTLDFASWFADYLRERTEEAESRLDEGEVLRLLDDKNAVRFLIAWSLLEQRCFGGYVTGKILSSHCQRLVNGEGFDPAP